MSRVRFGLTGLALVFLLALSVAALFGGGGGAVPEQKGEDPLATLGVAPRSEPVPAPEPAPRARADAPASPPLAPLPVPAPEDMLESDPLDTIPRPGESPSPRGEDADMVEI